MKFRFLLFFLSIITFANAQPGDIFAMKKARVQQIEAALQNDPNNVSLIWERIELAFKPHFDLYKKAVIINGSQYSASAYPYYVLEDLDNLIADRVSIKAKNKEISLADFYFRRGQFLYLTGHVEYVLQDYLAALEHQPSFQLKRRICLAIAAYYYNLDENYSLENYEKALAYIDLVTPKEDLNKPLMYERYSSRNSDYFEREKIQLLKATQKKERLLTYLKCIAKSHLLFYEKETKRSLDYQKSHSYTIKYSLQIALDKLYEIAIYFYENGQYEKAKIHIEKIISFLPKNVQGYTYETYAYGKYFLLLSKIYRTDTYQDVSLEIDNLLEGFGDPTQGFPSQARKEGNRLEKLLQLYPNAPKLHLAKAIYLKKIKYNKGDKKTAAAIIDLLQQSEAFGLQDYRIWYLRALLLKEEKRYEEALQEIMKAQILSIGHPNIYRLKLYLLEQKESSAETDLEKTATKSLLEISKKRGEVNVEAIVEMIHGM
ncbi:hypothetical protein [uncultured Kordia sp.]|uniref:tetratricopeptide repeat protein n=1 Tax=uncultured Kordia sp. TaxID=507699 RepID=UPI0026075F96|nr:hypothetical protein [uncultured Kordia sp.]